MVQLLQLLLSLVVFYVHFGKVLFLGPLVVVFSNAWISWFTWSNSFCHLDFAVHVVEGDSSWYSREGKDVGIWLDFGPKVLRSWSLIYEMRAPGAWVILVHLSELETTLHLR